MKNPLTKKQVGRVLIAAAIGAIVVAFATYFANLYVDSWHLAAQIHKPAWVYLFRILEGMCLDNLRLFGFGYPQSTGLFYLVTSIADGLVAFLYLLVPGFLWQLFRSYEHDHKAVA